MVNEPPKVKFFHISHISHTHTRETSMKKSFFCIKKFFFAHEMNFEFREQHIEILPKKNWYKKISNSVWLPCVHTSVVQLMWRKTKELRSHSRETKTWKRYIENRRRENVNNTQLRQQHTAHTTQQYITLENQRLSLSDSLSRRHSSALYIHSQFYLTTHIQMSVAWTFVEMCWCVGLILASVLVYIWSREMFLVHLDDFIYF